MEFNGRIVSAVENANGEWVVSIATRSVFGIEKLLNADLDVTIKKHRNKRSLKANAYYQELLTQLADTLTLSGIPTKKDELHAQMVCSYGQPLIGVDGNGVWMEIQCDRPYITVLDNYAIRRGARTVEKDGELVMMHRYQLFRGSSTYNSREFATLLEGLIAECKEQDIDTRTPAQVEEMIAAYKEFYG